MGSVSSMRPNVIGADELREYLGETELKQRVVPASAYVAEVAERLWGANRPQYPVLPWSKTHHTFAFRPGEVSLWAGINGHGKSMMLGQAVLSLCAQDQRCCVASFEMDPWRQMERLLRQSAGCEQPTAEWLDAFGQWTDGKLWFYDQTGTVRPAMIFALIRYCAEKLKVHHIVIDSLMKCMRAEDDMNAQKEFVDELCALAGRCLLAGLLPVRPEVARPARQPDQEPGRDLGRQGVRTQGHDDLHQPHASRTERGGRRR